MRKSVPRGHIIMILQIYGRTLDTWLICFCLLLKLVAAQSDIWAVYRESKVCIMYTFCCIVVYSMVILRAVLYRVGHFSRHSQFNVMAHLIMIICKKNKLDNPFG